MNVRPKGLINLGNTCYFNSVTQCLLNAPLFGHLLCERAGTKESNYTITDPATDKTIEIKLPDCDLAVKSLVELYRSYIDQDIKTKSLAPQKLLQHIRQKTGRFHKMIQEDSHELLRSLIDIVRSDEIRRQKAAITSFLGSGKLSEFRNECYTVIDMLFGGFFLSSVKCQKCKNKSQHLEPFYDLSLAITDPIHDVKDAISNFTANAILDGDNKVICEKCSKVNGQKTYEAGEKSTTIAVPPNILTLHLKRFEAEGGVAGGDTRGCKLEGGRKQRKNDGGNAGSSSGGRKGRRGRVGRGGGDFFVGSRGGTHFRKIDRHIDFSEFLNLADYTNDLCHELTKINSWPRINSTDPIWYSLFGVVCHSGSLRSGHYTAYIKYEESIHDQKDPDLKEFAQFIQETPYVPGSCQIEKIRESIGEFDSTHSESTEQYKSDLYDDQREVSDELPRSTPGNWYHISDSDVQKTSLTSVLGSQAYILFYKRII